MPDRASRDEGLQRVSRLTRWVAGASIVLAGVFSAVAAKAVPGKSRAAGPQPSQPAGATSQAQGSPAVTDGGSSQGDGGLVPPTAPPAPTGGSGSVSSGAS